MKTSNSQKLYKKAIGLFPGGVNSPVRAFGSVGAEPIYMQSAQGAYLTDADDNQYIDYIGAWGPAILGHSDPVVVDSVQGVLSKGLGFGTCHELEIQLAEIISTYMPSMESMRFVNSGTEACMSVVRLARAYTQRNKIIKFNGNYHGHADFFLVEAGSGMATHSIACSEGVPPEYTELTVSLPYNDIDSVKRVLEVESIAAIIIEPIVGNSGCLLPQQGFLEQLRELCDTYGTLLIFDEVMTGFRVARGGAQELFGVVPDLTTLGKVVGGGMPIGVYGGKKQIMEKVSPVGAMYQAGTLSGNPVCVAAGIATLRQLEDKQTYEHLYQKSEYLQKSIESLSEKYSIPVVVNGMGPMFTVFFTERTSVMSFEDAKQSNLDLYGRFFREMLSRGVLFPPSQFEAAFWGLCHTDDILDVTISKIEQSFQSMSVGDTV